MGQTNRTAAGEVAKGSPRLGAGSLTSAQQKWRDKLKDAKPAGIDYPDTQPEYDGPAMVAWARETLRVPPGHHLEGTPMALPDYGEKFILAALDPTCKDALTYAWAGRARKRQLSLASCCTFS